MKVTNVVATSEVHRREQPMQDAIQWLVRGHLLDHDRDGSGRLRSSDIYSAVGRRRPAVLAMLSTRNSPRGGRRGSVPDPGHPRQSWRETDYHGTAGWRCRDRGDRPGALDFAGRALEQRSWRLLGAYRDKVPTYAMVVG